LLHVFAQNMQLNIKKVKCFIAINKGICNCGYGILKKIPLVKLIVVANYSAQKTFARGAVDLVNGTLLTQCHRSKSLNLGAI